MEKAERQRLKQLANDSIIATFGEDTSESKLAEALEKCVEELDDMAQCSYCDPCDKHNLIT